jgi:hypothetical protein
VQDLDPYARILDLVDRFLPRQLTLAEDGAAWRVSVAGRT